jgi:NitT/TauT family transport system permease protein
LIASTRSRDFVIRAVSLEALVLLWQIGSLLLGPRKLPSPATVAFVLGGELSDGSLLYHLGITLLRVAASFFVAMAIGCGAGIAMGRLPGFDRFFDSWLIVLRHSRRWSRRALLSVVRLLRTGRGIAVAINKSPNVAVTMREGARAISRDNLEMAAVFRFGWIKTLRHVIVPELAPFSIAAARSGLALIWKIVLVVELLGRSNGVGFQIAHSSAFRRRLDHCVHCFVAVVQRSSSVCPPSTCVVRCADERGGRRHCVKRFVRERRRGGATGSAFQVKPGELFASGPSGWQDDALPSSRLDSNFPAK